MKMHFLYYLRVPFLIRLARPSTTKIPTVTAKKASKTPSTKTAAFQQFKQSELCCTSSVSWKWSKVSLEKLTKKVPASLSSIDSEVKKCKSKPEVTFLLIILNLLWLHQWKKKIPFVSKLTRTEKNTLRPLSENYILHKWCPGQSAEIKLCCPFSHGTC